MNALFSIGLCLGSLMFLLWLLRRDRLSLGLPVAYLLALLLIHVPGAYAYLVSGGQFGSVATEIGIGITAIGVVAFVAGVWLARYYTRPSTGEAARKAMLAPGGRPEPGREPPGPRFWMFCLIGGWFLIYGVSAVVRIPSISAAVDKGGAIWMLGVMLGLKDAIRRRDTPRMVFWGSMTFVYPFLMLVLGGFLSYGSTAIIVVFSLLTVIARRYWVMIGVLSLICVIGLNVFVNYFAGRREIRDVVWSGASMSQRIDVIGKVIGQSRLFDVKDERHLFALDERLNQNRYVGLAAERLSLKQVDYLRGQSVVDGAAAIVPRVLWPNKPIGGGSGKIVADMTGLNLHQDTSWGVGNVMEFYINFGLPGVIGGFLVLGFFIGRLDRLTVEAIRTGRLGEAFIVFLPCLALIQPNGSVVELTSAAAAGLAAGFAWRYGWRVWSREVRWGARRPQRLAARAGFRRS